MAESPLIAFMPSGRPAPPLLTTQELIEILRIDTAGVKFPQSTLERYRRLYPSTLRPVQVSRKVFYRLRDALELIDRLAEANPH